LVVIETFARFLSKEASIDIVHKKRAWSVLRVSEILVEYFHNSEASVKTNEIS
jgi:hypothetical protein